MRLVALTPETIADYGVCGYKDAQKHLELQRKIAWFERYYPMGLRITALVSESGGYQGMIEYLPGELAHRPVRAAAGYPEGLTVFRSPQCSYSVKNVEAISNIMRSRVSAGCNASATSGS